jgi:type II secretion system protein H
MTTTSPTGKAQPDADASAVRHTQSQARAFTLVELILVMALLGVVLAAGAPALSRFFQGRTLDSEARRFLALTRYAQNRAVSEGVPMVLWIDPDQKTYGLQAETSYTDTDSRAVEFACGEGIVIEPELLAATGSNAGQTGWRQTAVIARNHPALRFTPEGFISPTSPERVVIREENIGTVWIGQSQTRLHYEIQTNTPSYPPR